MNHLCDLTIKLDGGAINRLATDECAVLTEFRSRYESALRLNDDERRTASKRYLHGETNDESEHKINEAIDSSSTPLATYVIDHESLPPSGLRALDDVTLYRYLLADRRADGTFEPDLSYQRLLLALEFRKRFQCDDIVRRLQNNIDELNDDDTIPLCVRKCQRLRVGIYASTDRESRPVVFERLGQFCSSGNVSKVSRDDWMLNYLYSLETHFAKMRESAMTTGTGVERIVFFADCSGVTSSIINGWIWKVVQLLKALANTVECHYPELVDHITLFNLPRAASAVFKVVKGFLDPVTANKIELYPGVPYARFAELLPDEIIPVEYGGKNRIDYPQTVFE